MLEQLIAQLDIEALLTSAVEKVPALLAAVFILIAFWAFFRIARVPLRRLRHRAALDAAGGRGQEE